MDFFERLSDPVYFSRFGNRFNLVFSILSILFWCFMIYMSVDSGKPKMAGFWAIWILVSVGNMIRSIKRLKRLNANLNP
ncbi:MAG TPA: hypothetical protein VGD89_01410 [Flavipsychrobacter sp.]